MDETAMIELKEYIGYDVYHINQIESPQTKDETGESGENEE